MATATHLFFRMLLPGLVVLTSLTSDQGAHFLSETIATLTREFFIQHHKSSPYHPQANKTMEAFNKILEMGMTKVCCTNRDDWDE
jgi:transposase InsO family protein